MLLSKVTKNKVPVSGHHQIVLELDRGKLRLIRFRQVLGFSRKKVKKPPPAMPSLTPKCHNP